MFEKRIEEQMKNIAVSLVLICLGHFLIDLYMNLLPGIMPALIETMGITLTLSGLLQTVLSATSSWLQPAFGYVAFRFKTQRALATSILLSAVFMSLVGLSKYYWIMLIVVTLGGIGSSIYHPLGSVAISGLTSKNPGMVMSLYITAGTLGTTLSPVITSFVKNKFGLQGILFLGIPGILTGLFFYFVKTSLKNIKREEPMVTPVANKSKVNLNLALLVAVVGLRYWVLHTFSVYIPVFYVSKGFSEEAAAAILSLYLLFNAMGGMFGGIITDKFGIKNTLVVSSLLAICCFSMFFITTGYVPFILLFLGATLLQSAYPGAVVLAQKLYPKNPSMATGFMQGFTFGLGGVGALIIGALSDSWGGNLEMALRTLTIVLIISLIVSFFLPTEKNKTFIESAGCQ